MWQDLLSVKVSAQWKGEIVIIKKTAYCPSFVDGPESEADVLYQKLSISLRRWAYDLQTVYFSNP